MTNQSVNPQYLALLATIANEDLDTSDRIDALEFLQEDLSQEHPYKHVPTWALFDRLLPAYAVRPYLIGGRAVMLPVSRPPTALADLWA